MAKEIALIDEIKSGSFDTSLIATFNAYLPFYEDVLLRHLIARGCRHNVVMMDARQCGEALRDQGSRPRAAGRKYTLIPVKAGKAFHPKIMLLAGRNHGTLLVGSHNLTMSGYGINRELSTRFEYAASRERKPNQVTLATFQAAYQFLKNWAGEFPEMIQDMFRGIERLAPWLREPLPAEAESMFAGSTRVGPSLWEQVEKKLPRKTKRVTIIGPFFDADLTFLKHLHKQLSPKELIVGIEPERVEITENAHRLLSHARFVDSSILGTGAGYLHAKALLIETVDGSDILITGSANPSNAAWLANPSDRNAEAILTQTNLKDRIIAEIKKLAKQPKLPQESWDEIGRKLTDRPQKQASVGSPLLAVATSNCFEVFSDTKKRRLIDEVRVLDVNGKILGSTRKVEFDNGYWRIPVDEPIWGNEAALLEFYSENQLQFQALIHHIDELMSHSQTDAQRTFHRSLATLSTEAPMLEEVLKIVNKVIFENLPEDASSKTERRNQIEVTSTEDAAEISGFEINLADTKKNIRKKRLYSEGDLGLILNALIHGLGQGLQVESRDLVTDRRSEEDLIESEDEELVKEIRVNGLELVRLCRQKLKTLFRRMLAQLQVATDDGNPLRPILQLAAVLGVVNHLRVKIEKAPWVPRGESLLPHDELPRFFLDVCWYLYSRQSDLLRKALDSINRNDCGEIPLVRGLLLWLAWECGFELSFSTHMTEADEEYDKLCGLDRLLQLAPDVFVDPDATTVARQAVTLDQRFIKYDDWLSTQLKGAASIAELSELKQKTTNDSDEVKRGDIVYRKTDNPPHLTVVIETDGSKARLAENEDTWYAVGFIKVISLPSIGVQQIQTASWSQEVWRRVLGS